MVDGLDKSSVDFFVGQVSVPGDDRQPDDPAIFIPNELKTDPKTGEKVAEALFGNHNADMMQEADSGSLIGRTKPGRGAVQKISTSAPLTLGDGALGSEALSVEQEDQEDAEDPAIAGKMDVTYPSKNLQQAPFALDVPARLDLFATGPSLVGRSDVGRGPMKRIDVIAPLHLTGDQLTIDESAISPAGTPLVAFRAERNYTDQPGIPHFTRTKVIFPVENYDSGSYFNPTTSRWTPPAGLVHIDASVAFTGTNLDVTKPIYVAIFKNNGVIAETGHIGSAFIVSTSCDDIASGTDYYEIFAQGSCIGGTGTLTIYGANAHTYFDAHMPVGGVKGDKGDTGSQGLQGPQGPAGPTGAASTVPGPTGPKGDRGDVGPIGSTGSTGAPGAQGPQGIQGPQGLIGPMGPVGPEGPRGLPGTPGTPGADGAPGVVTAVSTPLVLTSGTLSLDLTDYARKSQSNIFTATNYFTQGNRLVIGHTTSTGFGLEVQGLDSNSAGVSITSWYDASAGNQATIFLNRSKGATIGAHVAPVVGDNIGTVIARAADGLGHFTNVGSLAYQTDGAMFTYLGQGWFPGRVSIYTTGPGPTFAFLERFRVDKDGLVTFPNSAGQALVGLVTAPTPPADDVSTKVATTAFVDAKSKSNITTALDNLSFLDLNDIRSGVTPDVYGRDGLVPQLEVDSYGRLIQVLSNFPVAARNMLNGFKIDIVGGPYPAQFSVGPGTCADSTNTDIIVLPNTMTKLTAPWGETTSFNPLMPPIYGATESPTTYANQPDVWWFLYVIKRPDSGHVDLIISLSPVAPNLPSPYTTFRRIGCLYIDPTSNLLKVWQYGDEFILDRPILTYAVATLGLTRSLATVRTPRGISTTAIYNAIAYDNDSAICVLCTCPDHADVAPNSTQLFTFMAATSGMYACGANLRTRTNTNTQIGVRCDQPAGGGLNLCYITSVGWIDTRGRDGS